MNKKLIAKRAGLIIGSYFAALIIYALMESSLLFCPNKVQAGLTVFCVNYLWKATVWSIFTFVLIAMLYFVERKYLNTWKSLAMMLFIPTVWSLYYHYKIVNISQNANSIWNGVYSSQEVWLVFFINLILLFGFLFWFKKTKNRKLYR